jgi:hypothetical protein
MRRQAVHNPIDDRERGPREISPVACLIASGGGGGASDPGPYGADCGYCGYGLTMSAPWGFRRNHPVIFRHKASRFAAWQCWRTRRPSASQRTGMARKP